MPFNQNKTERGIGSFPVIITEHGVVAPEVVPEVYLGRPGQMPLGVYDTMLAREGRFGNFEYHRQRFCKSCRDMSLQAPEFLSGATFSEWAAQVSAGGIQCRVACFREEQFLLDGRNFRGLVLMREYKGADASRGIKCAVSEVRRRSDDFSYHHKLTGRLAEEQALDEAKSLGFGDVVFLNDREEICEAAYSNVVLVKNGNLYSPGAETACLPGVTRKVLLEKAERLGIPVICGPVKKADLDRADEVWLTSSLRGMQWVQQVSQYEGEERPKEGSVYARLNSEFLHL